jgi:16S rRNA processing protein RimM
VSPAPNDELPWPQDAVEVARVLGAWGVKGWLRIQPYSADPQAVFSTKRWLIQPPELRPGAVPGTGPKTRTDTLAAGAALPSLLKVVQAKVHGDGVVAQVQDVADRSAAEALKGVRIFVPRASFPTAKTDEYYWIDLIGLDVVNREGAALGRVTELVDTGAHSVLRLDAGVGADGKPIDRMIPFVGAYIDSVDLAGRRIVADWGLDY